MALTVTTTTAVASNADNLTINKPSDVQIGDTLIIIANGVPAITPDFPTVSGFTRILTSSKTSSPQAAISMLYRIADASDVSASNYSIGLSGAANLGAAAMLRVRGLGSGNPLFASATASDAQDSASWTHSSGAISLSRPNEQLLIMAGQFNGDSNSGSFGNYVITSSDANPTWTEVLDTQYAVDSQPVEQALFVAYAITTDTSIITQYSVDVAASTAGTADAVATFLAVIVEPVNATGTNALLEVQPAIFTNAGVEVGTTGTNALLEVEPEIFNQSGRAEQKTVWVNETKPSTTWVNEE